MIESAAPRSRIAVAGATGFVGRALVDTLAPNHHVLALGRSVSAASDRPGVEHRRCDLYDVGQAAAALEGADTAVYLVHSMLPSARLVQASFADLDLVCADNFARAAARAGVKHIVYLGGIVPEGPGEGSEPHLSEHLRSREEVERVLASHGARVTSLRAGLVIGPGGSSFDILLKLTQRLPWMVIPRWGSVQSQPIGLADVVALLVYALEHPELAGHAYDVGSPSRLSYSEMLRETARLLGRRARILELPFDLPGVSLLWVSTITGASRQLVLPLVESLKHPMIATRGLELQRAAGVEAAPFEVVVREALAGAARSPHTDGVAEDRPSAGPQSRRDPRELATPQGKRQRRVVSLQRFPNPRGLSSHSIAELYFDWLPAALRPMLRVSPLPGGGCSFALAVGPPLLELSLDREASEDDRTVYRITGGALVAPTSRGQGVLEFRCVLGGSEVTTLVSNFEPRLPWFIYKYTQAIAHLLVMRAFGRYLARTRNEAALGSQAGP
jgi:uncharacterized protein YbjT (DUF2867 family)